MNTILRICACVYLVVFCLTSVCAKPIITKTLCNYQSGEMAIVEGKIRLGWQYMVDQGASSLQKSYQIVVHERLTHRLIYDSGNVISDESQLIEIPSLSPNQYGYTWKVRITSHSNHHKKGKTRFSPWSKEQIIRVAPNLQSSIFNLPSPQWIGAITKKDANIDFLPFI